MSNWEKGTKIEGENLEHLSDDAIVWVEWIVSGHGEPMLLGTIRQLGSPVETFGRVYNLKVETASLVALMDDHQAKWNAQPEDVKKNWLNRLFEQEQ